MHPSKPTSTAYSGASRRQANKSGFSMQVRDFGCSEIRTPQNGSSGGAGAPGRVRYTLRGLVDVGEGVGETRRRGRISYPSDPDLYALFDPLPPPPRVRVRTHWRLRIVFHVIGRRASNPRSKRHELGLYRISDVASFLMAA